MDKKYMGLLVASIAIGLVSIGGFGIKSYKAKASEGQITAINEVEIDDGFVVFTEVIEGKVVSEIPEAEVATGDQLLETVTLTNVNDTTQDDSNEGITQNDTSVNENSAENSDTVSIQIEDDMTIVPKYYNIYSDVVTIEDSSSYTASQAMDISGDYAYYVKIDSKAANDVVRNSRIWAYNLKTGKKQVVYDDNTSTNTFKIGHANCMCIKDGYMYIATMLVNEPTIRRYKIVNTGSKIYLTDVTRISAYSDKEKTKPLKVTGIHYAADMGGFIMKSGFNVYFGNIESREFNWTKHYKIDTAITAVTTAGVENIDVSKYVQQGLYYKNGKMYFSMMNNEKSNQSVVVEYPISVDTPVESIIPESKANFFRITSEQCSKLFEIENVAEYNGEMYAILNATYTGGGTCDRIIKFKDFRF